VELDPVDRITADAVGEPGDRTFFLQARKGQETLTVVLEKEQVRLLAASIMEILEKVGIETDPAAVPDADLGLEEPVVGLWRAGRLSIGYQEERDLLVLDLEEMTPEDEEGQDRVPEEARVWATREQMLAMARHGAEVVAAGRPACQLCGQPMNPEGHWCAAKNGHREIGSV
jgi:uncharacterized repeat protein (TIGR03847 family)